jgi:hypothetical protein
MYIDSFSVCEPGVEGGTSKPLTFHSYGYTLVTHPTLLSGGDYSKGATMLTQQTEATSSPVGGAMSILDVAPDHGQILSPEQKHVKLTLSDNPVGSWQVTFTETRGRGISEYLTPRPVSLPTISAGGFELQHIFTSRIASG